MASSASALPWSTLSPLRSARGLIEGPSEPIGDVPVSALEAAFEQHLAELRARFGRVLMGWTLVMNLLWLPTDYFLVTGVPHGLAVMSGARLAVLFGTLASLALLYRQPVLAGPRLLVGLLIWMLTCAAIGYAVMAEPDLGRPWFAFIMPLLIGTFVVPVPLRQRVPTTLALAGSLLASILLRNPAAWQSIYLRTSAGYLLFTAGAGITFGHAFWLLLRNNLHHRMALEKKSAELDHQRARLAGEVRERTDDLRLLSQHVERASELEGRRIARELHDELGQGVSALRLALAATRRRFARSPALIAGNLEELDELIRRVADGTRQAIAHLRPQLLTNQGLVGAAEWLVGSTERRGGFPCTLRVDQQRKVEAGDVEEPVAGEELLQVHSAAFRVLQESLTNVLNHAEARHAEVSLRLAADSIELEVRDDGVGLPPEGTRRRGMGLLGMRERVASLGGELRVEPAPGGGTVVACRLPLPEPRP